jgi:class 3 adenylate cyclase/tetratricopeptide (TPR) repeat protein
MPAGRQPSIATFVFTDIVDSTKRHDALGDEAAQEILRVHNALMRVEIARFGGSELKTMGDGFMIAFRSVTAALGCAVAVQRAITRHNHEHPDRSFFVRIGLNAGEAIEEDGDFFGTPVIIAARIAALAGAGEIITTAAVKQLAEGMRGIEYEEKGEVQLKGLSQPYLLYYVLTGTVEAPVRAALRRPEFVGRHKELEELKASLQAVAGGRGLCPLIIGEPGAGKTRLAEEAAQQALSQGYRVWRGRCYSTEGGLPYMPFVEMLREYIQHRPDDVLEDELEDDAAEIARLVPELARRLPLPAGGGPMPPEQERFRLLEAVRRLLERLARRRPLLLAIDDLQWADSATCILLRHLAPTVARTSICIMGTCHSDKLPAGHPLTDVLGEFGRLQIYQRIALPGLGSEEVQKLLSFIGGAGPPEEVVELVHGQTEGNAFFLTELINQLNAEGRLFDSEGGWQRHFSAEEWDIPESIRVVIQRRLGSLGEEARRLLSVACVAYKDFTFELLETVTNMTPDALLDGLDDAMRTGVVDETEKAAARYRFAHELTRQSLYEELSPVRRQRHHLRLGEAIEEVIPLEPEAIAHHFLNAGAAVPEEKTRRYLILAGDKATTSAAWEEAARYYQRALEIGDGLPPLERADLQRRLGLARSGAGDWEEAVAGLSEAMILFEEIGEREQVGWIGYLLRRLYGARGQFTEASAVVQRSLAFLGDADSEVRSRLLAQGGFFSGAFGNETEADNLLEQSMQMAERLENPAAIGFAHYTRGIHCMSYSHLAQSADSLGKGAEWSLKANDLWTASLSSSFRRRMLFSLGEVGQAEEAMDEQEKLARRAGNFLASCETKWLSSTIACLHGDLEHAETLATEVLGLIETSGAHSGMPGALINLAYIRFLQGDAPNSDNLLLRAIDAYDQMSAAPTDDPRPVLLLLRALTGPAEQGLAVLPTYERYFRFEDPWTASLGEARLTLATALVALDEKDLACSLFEPLKEWTRSSGYVLTGLASIPQLVSRALGMLAEVRGAPDEAGAYFDTAISQARDIAIPTELAEACYWYARFLLGDDAAAQQERGREFLTEATHIWERCGMPAQLERARRLASDRS